MSTHSYSISADTLNSALSADRLTLEIQQSSITIALDRIDINGDNFDVVFKASLSAGEITTLNGLVAAHTGQSLAAPTQLVKLDELKASDGTLQFTPYKSYKGSSKSFCTPDYSNPCTWFEDTTQVVGEVLSTVDNTVYTSGRTVTNWNHYWIDWTRIPNSARQVYTTIAPKVYKNDVVITNGFTLDCTNGTVTFDSANDPSDVIKIDYYYGNSPRFTLAATAGKMLLVDYVELQFTVGCSFPANSPILFEPTYNGPALPANSLYQGFPGYPANTDLMLNRFYYYDADDFLNESTGVQLGKAFGRLNTDFMILPWEYLTGYAVKAPGDTTTNIANKEWNKLIVRKFDNKLVTNCEIATATFYCRIVDV